MLAAVLLGCGAQKDDLADEKTELLEQNELLKPAALATSTVTVQKKDVVKADYELGYVVPTTYNLSFEIDGVVSYCDILPGDSVKQYQELASIDQTDLEEELVQLDEQYAQLEKQYALLNQQWEEETLRMQEQLAALAADTEEAELLQLSIDERAYAHEAELEEQEQALLVLSAEYDEKNKSMTKNHILSPCDGIVMDVTVRPGMEAQAGVCVITIGDYNNCYISCDTYYSEDQINKLVSVSAFLGSETFSVEYLPYTAEELWNGGSVSLSSRFQIDTASGDVQPGDYGAVQLVSELAEDVLCVPKSAVYNDTDGYYVYKDLNGARQRVDITKGLDNGMEVEILEGDLEEGDVVYVQ